KETNKESDEETDEKDTDEKDKDEKDSDTYEYDNRDENEYYYSVKPFNVSFSLPELPAILGTRGTYGVAGTYPTGGGGIANSHYAWIHRDNWVNRLIRDFITRNYDGNFDGVFISNTSANSNMGPWNWNADDTLTLATVEANWTPAARANTIVLNTVTGTQLITALNNNAARPYGAFFHNGAWNFNDGTEIEPSEFYTVATNSFNQTLFPSANRRPLLVGNESVTLPVAAAHQIVYLSDNNTDVSNPTVHFSVTQGEGTITTFPLSAHEDRLLTLSGTRVILTANRGTGYEFVGWYEGTTRISEENVISFYHTNDKTVEAHFRATEAPTSLPHPNGTIGIRGIYGGTGNIGGTGTTSATTDIGRINRDLWIGRLVADFIDRHYTGDFDGIFISNAGGMSNAGPWSWNANEPLTYNLNGLGGGSNIVGNFAPAARGNFIVMHTLTGSQLIQALNVGSSSSGNNHARITGAYREGTAWYFDNGIQITTNGTYTVASNNFGIVTGWFPVESRRMLWWDGTTRPLGYYTPTITNNIPAYPSNAVFLPQAAGLQVQYRYENETDADNISFYFEANGNGRIETMPLSAHEGSLVTFENTRVTLTAIPEEGYVLTGWYVNDTLISSDQTYSFFHTKDTVDKTVEAHFELDDNLAPLRVDLLAITDFHGMVDNLMDDNHPGAGLLAAYARMYYDINPGNTMMLAAGDNFHGHPLSTHLGGAPAAWLHDFMDINYSALGNHEFSFGAINPTSDGRPHPFGNATFLAADLVYADHMPRAGQHPDFVEPYTVVNFHDEAVSIGIIGLMTTSMATSTNPALLTNYELRTPTLSNSQPEWYEYIDSIVDRLRNYYDVNAVVLLTHMTNNQAHILANTFDAGTFDAIIGGHLHVRHASRNNQTNTLVMEPGHHGNTVGRITFNFDANTGDIVNMNHHLSPVNAVRDFRNNPNFTANTYHPDFGTYEDIYNYASGIMQEFNYHASEFLDEPLGPRGTHGMRTGQNNTQGRAIRDAWITRLASESISNTYAGEWSGIFMSNQGGWRNTSGMWSFAPNDHFLMRDLIVTTPFSDFIGMVDINGRDLITLLSMPSGVGGGGIGLPNGGISTANNSMHGAFRGEQIAQQLIGSHYRDRWEWFLEDGTQIRDDENVIYTIAARNFIINGGSNFPFPSNSRAEEFGMEEVGRGVRVLLSNGLTMPVNLVPEDTDMWEHWEEMGLPGEILALRYALADQLRYRRDNYDSIEDFTSVVTIDTDGSGTANMQLFIPQPNQAGQSVFMMNMPDDLTVINGTRVFLNATPAVGYEFIGWADEDGYLFSAETNYSFASSGNQELVAVFRSEGYDGEGLPERPEETPEPDPAPPIRPRPPINNDKDDDDEADEITNGATNVGDTTSDTETRETDGIWTPGRPVQPQEDYTPPTPELDQIREQEPTPVTTPPTQTFNDVNSEAWYHNYINTVVRNGLFQGTAPGVFSPQLNMTRAMFTQVLANLEGVDLSLFADESSIFNDVSNSAWYFSAVQWASNAGIINGTGEGNFTPDDNITREQMAVMLYRFVNIKEIVLPQGTPAPSIEIRNLFARNNTTSFSDENHISAWAIDAVKAIQSAGIVRGRPNNSFDPQASATRAEVAAIFTRFLEIIEN
ncbi:MAG: S-layer homology domain-containing protein, partial [Defluviitaleaceae bacterium]|nr:S-layer homology domain-containing protein [Defluviitaleaceae bacterium]